MFFIYTSFPTAMPTSQNKVKKPMILIKYFFFYYKNIMIKNNFFNFLFTQNIANSQNFISESIPRPPEISKIA
jgi:hypothetical protein